MTRNQILHNLKGVIAPVTTPFDRRGALDEKRFRENLERYTGIGLGGILITGSTGEAPYLSERERLRLVEIAREAVRPPELLIVGTGLESTPETLRLSREAIARGADALLVVTPNYYKARMDHSALAAHYRAVADGVRRPLLIYSIPQFTGIEIGVETIAALARHPNIVGLKDSLGSLALVRRVLRRVGPGFRVLVGAASIFLDSLRSGAVGGVLAQADFAPELCVGVYEAFRQGRIAAARHLQDQLAPLQQQIGVPYGVAGIKAALDASGYYGGPPRPPLLPLKPGQRRAVAAVVRQAHAGVSF
ncbi:MAG TPA: dihydrodipicolinate synthase family protein [Terriglobia bacterium]|nr:dihydrodipicolinate synthase family protein [Terriglobia bacterium]